MSNLSIQRILDTYDERNIFTAKLKFICKSCDKDNEFDYYTHLRTNSAIESIKETDLSKQLHFTEINLSSMSKKDSIHFLKYQKVNKSKLNFSYK